MSRESTKRGWGEKEIVREGRRERERKRERECV
jgi:hypothetical protein